MKRIANMTGPLKSKRVVFLTVFILFSLIVFVVSEKFGDGDSFFGNVEGIDELCDGKKCKFKVVGKSEEEVEATLKEVESSLKDEKQKSDNTVTEEPTQEEIFVMITFTNAVGKTAFHKKFELTVTSLLEHASKPIALHILGDPESQEIAKKIIKQKAKPKSSYRIVGLEVKDIAMQIDEIIRPMQHHFSYKPGAYYSDALFFLSIGIHRVMPEDVHKVIMLDADLKFTDDIAKLYERFRLFRKDNIIGIGYDLQPVYRHQFWKYRSENPGTRVGEPGPGGLQGFNSGVLLLNLDKMRHSALYNSLINAEAVEKLTKEFSFKGHLGDQDFFTLVGMKYEWLFHVLPCQWNRQLCTWWKDKGHEAHFHLYYDCEDPIKIWHGNCNTPIPN